MMPVAVDLTFIRFRRARCTGYPYNLGTTWNAPGTRKQLELELLQHMTLLFVPGGA